MLLEATSEKGLTTVDGPLLSIMLLLAHCSAAFCGEQRETQETKQTMSLTLYNNNSNQVLDMEGLCARSYARRILFFGFFFFFFGNIVARNFT